MAVTQSNRYPLFFLFFLYEMQSVLWVMIFVLRAKHIIHKIQHHPRTFVGFKLYSFNTRNSRFIQQENAFFTFRKAPMIKHNVCKGEVHTKMKTLATKSLAAATKLKVVVDAQAQLCIKVVNTHFSYQFGISWLLETWTTCMETINKSPSTE